MSKIKNDGLDQYAAEPFQQQRFGTAGVEVVKEFYDDDEGDCVIDVVEMSDEPFRRETIVRVAYSINRHAANWVCLLYTSDAADE